MITVFLMCILVQDPCPQPTLIYMVRHAEKMDASRDPNLNQTGRQRAQALAQFFESIPIDRLISSQFKRTQQTLEPLSKQRQLPITEMDARDNASIVAQLESHCGDAIIICGHSNTIPALIGEMACGAVSISDSDYDDLFLLVVDDTGCLLQNFQFVP